MKLGVLADVHGNLPALESAWTEMQEEHEVDATVCVGDIVGVLGWPEETAKFIRENVDYAVFGNHDAYIRSDFAYIPEHAVQKQEHRVVTSKLTEETIDWLNGLPEKITIDDNVDIAHAHPYKEPHHGYPADNYVNMRDWTSFGSDYMDGQIVLIAHTHDAGKLNVGKFEGMSGVIVNPGSVGQPWFKDAKYAIVDTETQEASLHRTSFDESRLRSRFNELKITQHGDK